MRSTTVKNVTLAATFALTVALTATSLPAAQRGVAARRGGDFGLGTYVETIVAKVKKLFGVSAMGEPQIPIPASSTTTTSPTAPSSTTTGKK